MCEFKGIREPPEAGYLIPGAARQAEEAQGQDIGNSATKSPNTEFSSRICLIYRMNLNY